MKIQGNEKVIFHIFIAIKYIKCKIFENFLVDLNKYNREHLFFLLI